MTEYVKFDYRCYTAHGKQWRLYGNVESTDYLSAARYVHRMTGKERVRVCANDAAAFCSMDYKNRTIKFTKKSEPT